MSLAHNIKRIFTWWDGQPFGTQLWTSRNGTKVGEDAQGNVFYRNSDDSRRWVIYNGENEASRVAAQRSLASCKTVPGWRLNASDPHTGGGCT